MESSVPPTRPLLFRSPPLPKTLGVNARLRSRPLAVPPSLPSRRYIRVTARPPARPVPTRFGHDYLNFRVVVKSCRYEVKADNEFALNTNIEGEVVSISIKLLVL